MKQLLPKHLAEKAEKLDPTKVEAEIVRIINSSGPQPSRDDPWGLGMGNFPQLQQGEMNRWRREQELQMQRAYQQGSGLGSWGSIF